MYWSPNPGDGRERLSRRDRTCCLAEPRDQPSRLTNLAGNPCEVTSNGCRRDVGAMSAPSLLLRQRAQPGPAYYRWSARRGERVCHVITPMTLRISSQACGRCGCSALVNWPTKATDSREARKPSHRSTPARLFPNLRIRACQRGPGDRRAGTSTRYRHAGCRGRTSLPA
jgi:hypothetical protein